MSRQMRTLAARYGSLRFGGGLGHDGFDRLTAVPVELVIGQRSGPLAIVSYDIIVVRRALHLQLSNGSRVCHDILDAKWDERGLDRRLNLLRRSSGGGPTTPGEANHCERDSSC